MPWRRLSKGTLKGLSDATLDRTLSPMPRFFLTGDGHGYPPFEWINACPRLRAHFIDLMAKNKLCAHVEQFKDQVTAQSIPLELCQLYDQRRVFGWELEIFADLLPIIDNCREIAPPVQADHNVFALLDQIVDLLRRMSRVSERLSEIGNPASLDTLARESARYTKYFEGLKQRPTSRDRARELDCGKFLMAFQNEVGDKLRTDVNPYIGANIQKKIIEFADCTHLITCGGAHITTNPLDAYIPLAEGAEGVVDEDDCRDIRGAKKPPPVQKQPSGFWGLFGWLRKG